MRKKGSTGKFASFWRSGVKLLIVTLRLLNSNFVRIFLPVSQNLLRKLNQSVQSLKRVSRGDFFLILSGHGSESKCKNFHFFFYLF